MDLISVVSYELGLRIGQALVLHDRGLPRTDSAKRDRPRSDEMPSDVPAFEPAIALVGAMVGDFAGQSQANTSWIEEAFDCIKIIKSDWADYSLRFPHDLPEPDYSTIRETMDRLIVLVNSMSRRFAQSPIHSPEWFQLGLRMPSPRRIQAGSTLDWEFESHEDIEALCQSLNLSLDTIFPLLNEADVARIGVHRDLDEDLIWGWARMEAGITNLRMGNRIVKPSYLGLSFDPKSGELRREGCRGTVRIDRKLHRELLIRLIEAQDEYCPLETLLQAWQAAGNESSSKENLRSEISKILKCITPLQVSIQNARNRGYRLIDSSNQSVGGESEPP